MKNIVLKRLSLLNFKGLRQLTADFGEQVTDIRGANATGKTTVFDAFRWVLFGKDSTDRKDFNIKTLDEDGKPLERLPHEVTALISVNGEDITLKKCYSEKWTKKRGSVEEVFSGHTVECFFNDVPCTVKEYEAKVSEICDEQVFRLITDPLCFTAQKKDVQRIFLIRMTGNVEDATIIGTNPDFAPLAAMLTGKTLEELKRETAAKKRKIKDGIDKIPARIDERKRDMPEAYDWSAVEANIRVHEYEIERTDGQIADMGKVAREAMKQKDDIAKKIADTKKLIADRRYSLEESILSSYRAAIRDHREAISSATEKRHERQTKAIAIQRMQNELAALNEKRTNLITEWRAIKAESFIEPDPACFVCPTCKRPLDADDIESKTEEMRALFNSGRAERLEKNREQGLLLKQDIEAREEAIKEASNYLFMLESDIAEIENSAIFKEEPVKPETGQAVSEDAKIQELEAETERLQKEFDKGFSAPDTSELQELKRKHQEALEEDKAKLRNRETINAINGRILELEQEYRKGQEEVARLEGLEYVMAQFGKARMEQLEKRINGLFTIVRFKMYEQQINGGEVETCEAMVDGVPFADLNNAAKTNAGLDIINAICKAYGTTAPVFLDNREGVTQIIPTQSQIVNLIVDAQCTQLTITK